MTRRKALQVLGVGLAGVAIVGGTMAFWKQKAKENVKAVLRRVMPAFRFPAGGRTVSAEKAMNSRCNSDHDGYPAKDHWGMFDRWKELTIAQTDEVIRLAKVPRFTEGLLEARREGNILTFIGGRTKPGVPQSWAMVENGMLQQAVCLVCAALGVGMVFSNMGKDGRWVSEKEYAAIKMRLGAMEPSYEGAYWSSSPPAGKNPWQRGNLPDPIRDGKKPLLSILTTLKTENRSPLTATEHSISQVLWACRGRTPHFYNSKPWGMTIPTWAGEQNLSSAYLLRENQLLKYVNWNDDRPTHSLLLLREGEAERFKETLGSFYAKRGLIVLGKNESLGRALWEVGYQLMNMLLLARGLDISYGAFLLKDEHKEKLERIGVADPVAVMAL